MSGDVIDVESTEVTVAALAPAVVQSGSLVRPAASVGDIEEAFRAYSTLCASLLDAGDVQRIGDKDFRKKSAWRKLAVAFGVSCELVSRDYERENGRIIRAEVVVRATAPNGRHMDGLGACDLYEKCCLPGCRKRHQHCATDCDPRRHFSNPQHDLPATAMTRATNRACADLFGMGEVSAEEIVGGIVDDDGHHAPVGDVSKMQNRDVVDALRARGLPLAGTPEELRARLAEALGQQPEAPADPSGGTQSPVPSDAPSPAAPSHVEADERPGAEHPAVTEASAPGQPIDKAVERLQKRLDALPDVLRRSAEDELYEGGFMPQGVIACEPAQVSEVSKRLDRFEEDANGAPGLQARAASKVKGTAA